MNLIRSLLIFLLVLSYTSLYSQDSLWLKEISATPSKFTSKLESKYNSLITSLETQTQKHLTRARRAEERMYRRLYKKDSIKARLIYGDIAERYQRIESDSRIQAPKLSSYAKVYNGRIDSLLTIYKFIGKSELKVPKLSDGITDKLAQLNTLQTKLDEVELIKKQLVVREHELMSALNGLGLRKELKRFSKEIFYYQQYFHQVKEVIKNPTKLEAVILSSLAKAPRFNEFFSKHSMFAQLFRLPSSANQDGQSSLNGLQTRGTIRQLLQDRFGAGTDIQQKLQESITAAKSQVMDIRGRAQQVLPQGANSDDEIPDFKPNSQRTKNFMDRLEVGTTFQSSKANGLLPNSTDIGITVGYKLNDKGIIGIGGAYKIGWGNSIRHIKFSHQGAGIKTFLDWKIKWGVFLSCGYERDFLPTLASVRLPGSITGADHLKTSIPSGLLGISKTFEQNAKWLKGTRVQVLWDFVDRKNYPTKQKLVFRFGYIFK